MVDSLGYTSGPSVVPVQYAPGNNTGTIYSGNLHYSAHCHTHRSIPSVPSDFTGTMAGNRHYGRATIDYTRLLGLVVIVVSAG